MRRLATALVVAAVAGTVATLAACDRTVAGGSTDGATVFRAACAS